MRVVRSKGYLLPVSLVSATIVALVTSGTAWAASYAATSLQYVGDHPLSGCSAPAVGGTNYAGAEVEPNLAVNPVNPDNVIEVYQQDRWSNGGAHALWSSVTFSGTKASPKWSAISAAPAFDVCTGNSAYDRASDPWVTFSPDGTAYQIAITFTEIPGAFSGPSGVMVSQSSDGGSTWGAPTSLIADNSLNILNDKESITADRTTSQNVYAIWDRLVAPSGQAAAPAGDRAFGYRGPTWFSRTTDHGASWSPATMIYDPGEENQTIGNVIVVTPAHPTASNVPGGQLVDGFDLLYNFKNSGGVRGFNVAVMRSADQGSTWSSPTIIDKQVVAPVSITVNGQSAAVRTGDIIPEFAVDGSSGYIYAVWQDGRWGGIAQTAFSMSKDGGVTWSPTIRINDPTSDSKQVFTPTVAVANDGTVGVTYYELEDATGTTTYQFVSCSANCTSTAGWAGGATQVGSSFQMSTAPYAGGYFVGDYQGLAAYANHGFRTAVVMAQPVATHGPTDPFSDTICPSTGC
jgi:hypothetical protein